MAGDRRDGMEVMERPMPGGRRLRSMRSDLWIVAGAAALILLPWIGGPALFDRDETYYAEGAREMQEAGTWTRPLLNGQDFHQKPFLPFALIRIGYAALGVNETAARFPSALLGIGTAVLTAAIGSRLCGRSAGLRAGIVLASSLLFLLICRSSLTDPAFLFFFTAALFFFLNCAAGQHPTTRDLVGMYAAGGLAALCKGPIGVLLLGGIGFVILARGGLSGTLSAIRRFRPLFGLGILSAVALPWYVVAAARTRGASLRDFVVQENLGRFLSPMEGHRGPFWIYVPVLVLTFLPWSVFLPRAWKELQDPSVRRILGAWFAIPFLFFSAAATKLPHYMLPVFPPLAILVGAGWDSEASPRAWRSLALSLLIPICLAFPVALFVARRRWPDLVPLSLIATAAVLPAGAGAALLARSRPRLAFGLLGGAMALFAWLACGWSLPALGEIRVVRPVGIVLRDHAKVPTYSYRFLEPGLLFYSRRTIVRLDRLEDVSRISASCPAFAIVVRREDVDSMIRVARRPLTIIGSRRGFCEDSGPVELVVLAAD